MMSGYQNQPDKTLEASWYDDNGERWQRMGDIGRVDEEGFVTLLGRSKDMIISGGFNIYPRDLEDALLKQPEVEDAAVIESSKEWGETPGLCGRSGGEQLDLPAVCARANAELGKTQRISALKQVEDCRGVTLARFSKPRSVTWYLHPATEQAIELEQRH